MKRTSARASSFVGLFLLNAGLGALASGCGDEGTTSRATPFVAAVDNANEPAPSSSPEGDGSASPSATTSPTGGSATGTPSTAIRSRVTLNLAALEGRVFLYGADVQTSARSSWNSSDTNSAFSVGHTAVRFRDAGDRLQLVEDQTAYFESDVAHPERLVFEIPIVARTESSITVDVRQGSPALTTLVGGNTAKPARASWLRSLSFVPESNLLLMQTSLETADGWVYEFAESIFPRESLVKPDFKPLSVDDPSTLRYGYLTAGNVWVTDKDTRTSTSFITRFDWRQGQTIDWYVTPNVADEFLPAIQAGVEGWNRYSKAAGKGDLVRFRGRLPEGIVVGDPRFNVIVWDNVADAGAAWESQAADPETGAVSHSLIYLPKAWFFFGEREGDMGSLAFINPRTQARQGRDRSPGAVVGRSFLGRRWQPACLRERDETAPAPPTDATEESKKAFGYELLRGTLFHEVGHALGLAHNFKASTGYDGKDLATFSMSIMDYNLYDLDRSAFDSPSSSDGPLLEYDRQALSALYNESNDIAEDAPTVPLCRDEDVPNPSSVGPIDPFCLQYDGGKDPIGYVERNLELMTNASASLPRVSSLPAALERGLSRLPDSKTITTESDARSALSEHARLIKRTLRYYASTRVVALLDPLPYFLMEYAPGALPEGLVEADVRARAFTLVEKVGTIETLPMASAVALRGAIESAQAWLETTPAYGAMNDVQKEDFREMAMAPLVGTEDWVIKTLLPSIRGSVMSSLWRSDALPYAFSRSEGLDYEAKVVDVLEKSIFARTLGNFRSLSERKASVSALATFRQVTGGKAAVARVRRKLNAELREAKDTEERSGLRELLTLLDG